MQHVTYHGYSLSCKLQFALMLRGLFTVLYLWGEKCKCSDVGSAGCLTEERSVCVCGRKYAVLILPVGKLHVLHTKSFTRK